MNEQIENPQNEHLRVIVLDDEPIVGKRLQPALEKMGWQVEVFEEPKKALERIDEGNFDIVVTDIYMNEVDGLQVLDRALEKNPNAKVIIITGYAMMEMARSAMDKGAFDFIAKPFKPDDLRNIISKAAASSGS